MKARGVSIGIVLALALFSAGLLFTGLLFFVVEDDAAERSSSARQVARTARPSIPVPSGDFVRPARDDRLDAYEMLLESRSAFTVTPVDAPGRGVVDGDRALVLLTPAWVSPAAQFRARRQLFALRRVHAKGKAKWTVARVLDDVTRAAGLRWDRHGGDVRVLASDEAWEAPTERRYPVEDFGRILPVRLVNHWPAATLRAERTSVVLRTLPSLHAEIRYKLGRLKNLERHEVSFRFRWNERTVSAKATEKAHLRRQWSEALAQANRRAEER